MPDPIRKNLEAAESEAPAPVETKEEAPEKVVEAVPETQPEAIEEPKEAPSFVSPAPADDEQVADAPLDHKDELTEEVEEILSEDLGEMYDHLPPDKQQAFKDKGEETAGKIQQMVASTKVKSRKILGLIKEWLKMIPGVNKFFLEQEAKIKTDKLLLLADQEQKEHEEEM